MSAELPARQQDRRARTSRAAQERREASGEDLLHGLPILPAACPNRSQVPSTASTAAPIELEGRLQESQPVLRRLHEEYRAAVAPSSRRRLAAAHRHALPLRRPPHREQGPSELLGEAARSSGGTRRRAVRHPSLHMRYAAVEFETVVERLMSDSSGPELTEKLSLSPLHPSIRR